MDERWVGDVGVFTVGSSQHQGDAVVDAVERLLDQLYDYGRGNLHFDIRVYEVDEQTATHRVGEQTRPRS
jgi:hypothetical protein